MRAVYYLTNIILFHVHRNSHCFACVSTDFNLASTSPPLAEVTMLSRLLLQRSLPGHMPGITLASPHRALSQRQ